MKNKNSFNENEKSGTDQEFETIDYLNDKKEITLLFNKLTKNLINQYEKYFKTNESEVRKDNDEEDSTKIKNEYEIVDDPNSKTKLNSSELEICLKYFDKLIEFVLNLKQKNSFVLLSIFQKRNLIIIQLIEFLNKLLNFFNQPNCFSDEFNSFDYNQTFTKGIESKISFIGKTIQFIHVLTTNQCENNDDDESTVYYCNLLTTSFNFTSSISSILVLNNKSDQKSFLNEQYSKVCLDVLNNLTFDNRLFSIDNSIKKLIFQLVDKIIKGDLRPNYLQFLSNILRNENIEISKIFKSMNETTTRRFYRQLISIIKDNTNGLILISLMILIKLEYEDLFSIVLPIKLKPSSYSIYEPIDCAMGALNDININKKINSSQQKSNAINFLYEFVKCEPVRILLEGNEGYTDVFMFKLNQFLVQSHSSNAELPLNASKKVVNLFDQLISSSEKLAKKQYQIIFDTKNFIESANQCDLSSKLKDLALTTKRKSGINGYDYLLDYYLKISEIKFEDSDDEDASKFSHLYRNSCFYLSLFKHLFNLFKKNEKFRSDCACSKRLIDKLIKNFYNLNNFYLDQNELDDSLIEANLAKIYFFNLGLIDSVLRSNDNLDLKINDVFRVLLDSVEQNILKKSSNSENELNYGNYLIVSKLLIRFYLNKFLDSDQDSKEKVVKIIKENRLIKSISYLITKSKEFSYRLMAHEIMFDIEQITKEIDFFPTYFLEAIVKTSIGLRDDTNILSVNEIQYPMSNFEKSFESINTVSKRSNDKKSYGDLDNLFDFYDFKLNEKIRQETHLINTLNQYFASSLLKETEFKALRDQIRNYAEKEIKFKKDMDQIQNKKSEYEVKYKELSKCVTDLERENDKMKEMLDDLNKQNENLKEKCTKLEKNIEQAEKDNEETVVSLQKMIEKEASQNKNLQSKLKESHQKISDLEQSKNSIESKKKELETKLEQIENDLKDKNTQFDSISKDYETLRNDHDKLKAILSYVKENYK